METYIQRFGKRISVALTFPEASPARVHVHIGALGRGDIHDAIIFSQQLEEAIAIAQKLVEKHDIERNTQG